MPKKVHDCAKKLQSEGKSEASSWAICNASIRPKGKKSKSKSKGKK